MVSDALRQKVIAYLDKNKARLFFFNVDSAMIDIRIFVPEARQITDSDLRSIVVGYYFTNNLLPTASPPPLPTGPDDDIIDAVKDAVTTVIKGVDIKRGAGKLNIAVTGATAELTKSGTTASVGVSWGGNLTVQVSRRDFYIQGQISKDAWQFSVNYPSDTAVPDLSKLGQVFGEGEKALIGIVKTASNIKDLKDIPTVADQFKPYIKSVGDAAEAAQGIAQAPKSGLSFGFKFGSPDPPAGQTGGSGIPKGFQASAVLTFSF